MDEQLERIQSDEQLITHEEAALVEQSFNMADHFKNIAQQVNWEISTPQTFSSKKTDFLSGGGTITTETRDPSQDPDIDHANCQPVLCPHAAGCALIQMFGEKVQEQDPLASEEEILQKTGEKISAFAQKQKEKYEQEHGPLNSPKDVSEKKPISVPEAWTKPLTPEQVEERKKQLEGTYVKGEKIADSPTVKSASNEVTPDQTSSETIKDIQESAPPTTSERAIPPHIKKMAEQRKIEQNVQASKTNEAPEQTIQTSKNEPVQEIKATESKQTERPARAIPDHIQSIMEARANKPAEKPSKTTEVNSPNSQPISEQKGTNQPVEKQVSNSQPVKEIQETPTVKQEYTAPVIPQQRIERHRPRTENSKPTVEQPKQSTVSEQPQSVKPSTEQFDFKPHAQQEQTQSTVQTSLEHVQNEFTNISVEKPLDENVKNIDTTIQPETNYANPSEFIQFDSNIQIPQPESHIQTQQEQQPQIQTTQSTESVIQMPVTIEQTDTQQTEMFKPDPRQPIEITATIPNTEVLSASVTFTNEIVEQFQQNNSKTERAESTDTEISTLQIETPIIHEKIQQNEIATTPVEQQSVQQDINHEPTMQVIPQTETYVQDIISSQQELDKTEIVIDTQITEEQPKETIGPPPTMEAQKEAVQIETEHSLETIEIEEIPSSEISVENNISLEPIPDTFVEHSAQTLFSFTEEDFQHEVTENTSIDFVEQFIEHDETEHITEEPQSDPVMADVATSQLEEITGIESEPVFSLLPIDEETVTQLLSQLITETTETLTLELSVDQVETETSDEQQITEHATEPIIEAINEETVPEILHTFESETTVITVEENNLVKTIEETIEKTETPTVLVLVQQEENETQYLLHLLNNHETLQFFQMIDDISNILAFIHKLNNQEEQYVDIDNGESMDITPEELKNDTFGRYDDTVIMTLFPIVQFMLFIQTLQLFIPQNHSTQLTTVV